MGRLRTELFTFCKAQLSAQMSTLADFALSFLLAEWVGVYYVVASFLGALTGGLVNCAINYRWVFKPHDVRKSAVLTKYLMVWLGSIALNTLGTFVVTELSRQHFICAKAVVAVLVAVLWNYRLQRTFVYR